MQETQDEEENREGLQEGLEGEFQKGRTQLVIPEGCENDLNESLPYWLIGRMPKSLCNHELSFIIVVVVIIICEQFS